MSRIDSDRHSESDECSDDGLGNGGVEEASDSSDAVGVGGPSNSTNGIPSEYDSDDALVRTGLLEKESRLLIL